MPTFLRDEMNIKDETYLLLGGIVIALVVGFPQFFYESITTKPMPRGFSFISLVLFVLFFFFWFLEFFGTVYDIKLFKYFFEHGLTYSITMFFFFTGLFLPLIIFEKYVNLEDVHYIIEFFGTLLALSLLLLPLYLIQRYYLKIHKLFADRLLDSNRYAPLKDKYRENIYRMTNAFYYFSLLIGLSVVLYNTTSYFWPEIPYASTQIFYVSLLVLLIAFIIYYFYRFYKLLDLQEPRFKEDLINFLRIHFHRFLNSIRRR